MMRKQQNSNFSPLLQHMQLKNKKKFQQLLKIITSTLTLQNSPDWWPSLKWKWTILNDLRLTWPVAEYPAVALCSSGPRHFCQWTVGRKGDERTERLWPAHAALSGTRSKGFGASWVPHQPSAPNQNAVWTRTHCDPTSSETRCLKEMWMVKRNKQAEVSRVLKYCTQVKLLLTQILLKHKHK